MRKVLLIFIAVILFLIPFFWLKPGEMDLGGDSSRLYFYDPQAYIASSTLYGISASSFGLENVNYLSLPFITLLSILKSTVSSPTILIAAFHGFTLSMEFVFMFFLIKEIIKGGYQDGVKNNVWYGALIGSLVYVLSPAIIDGWQYVLLTRSQIFLNPLIFYLLLKYFKTYNFIYIGISLLITFIFSPNFSIIAAPALVAFYPLSITFLLIYTKIILKKKIIIKHLVIAIVLFFGIHAFHLNPQLQSIFFSDSDIKATIFSDQGKFVRGLSYFSAIAPNIKVSINLLGFPQMKEVHIVSSIFLVFPFIILYSFFLKRNKILLLTASFFLVVLFFSTANITNIGLSFYKSLFSIPGFSMFRNYYGQWQFVYIFFYTLLFGIAIAHSIEQMKNMHKKILIMSVIIIFFLYALPFFRGETIQQTLWTSNNVKAVIVMDPDYEKLLTFVRGLPANTRFLTFPMTDPGYQIIGGQNGGAYVGPSTLAYLTGKKDFAGFEEFGEYKDLILRLAQDKEYNELKKLFGIMNIKYIFHNADPQVFDAFPQFPYQYVRKFLPTDQAGYKKFIQQLGGKEIKNINNKYYIYELAKEDYLPEVYASKKLISTNTPYFNRPYANSAYTEVGDLFSIYKNDKRIAQYNSTTASIYFDESFTEIQEKSSFRDFTTNIADSPYGFPHAAWKVNSFIYPFIMYREKRELAKYGQINDMYIDRAIFLTRKRIAELLWWRNEIPIMGKVKSIDTLRTSWKEPTMLEAMIHTNSQNYWEIALVRYQKGMFDLIEKIENTHESRYSVGTNKNKIKKFIIADREIIQTLIQQNDAASQKQKKYLARLSNEMFTSLIRRVYVPILSPEVVSYDVDSLAPGIYDIFIEKKSLQSIGIASPSIEINNNTVSLAEFNEENGWFVGKSMNVTDKTTDHLVLNVQPKNIILDSEWKLFEETKSLSDSLEFFTDDIPIPIENDLFRQFSNWKPENKNGLFREISGWMPRSYYILSFSYNTNGNEYNIVGYDKESGKNKEFKRIFENKLQSNTWKTYKEVIASSAEGKEGLLQILKSPQQNTDTGRSSMTIRNISLVQIPNPKILLKKTKRTREEDTIPHIVYTRINPTKYEVKITNAQAPYTLVLAQSFSQKWHVTDILQYDTSIEGFFFQSLGNFGKIVANLFGTKSSPSNAISTYFEGQVLDRTKGNTFIDNKTFETWGKKKIATEKHIPVNGYANAWYIEPDDVGGKKDYTLILELEIQKIFYISFALSLLTAFGLLLYVIYKLIHR